MHITSNNSIHQYTVARLRLDYYSVQTLVFKILDVYGRRRIKNDRWPTDFDKQIKRK